LRAVDALRDLPRLMLGFFPLLDCSSIVAYARVLAVLV
jgi:hypothetical protein